MNEIQQTFPAKKKWYQTNLAIIGLLIFFFPAGLFLMWKYARWPKKAKWVVSIFFIIVVAISAVTDNESPTSTSVVEKSLTTETVDSAPQSEHITQPQSSPELLPSPTPETIEPFDVRVTSQIVKKTDGKHRYFFDIRNYDDEPFEGSVLIQLFKEGDDNWLGSDGFNTSRPIDPGLGDSVYFDIFTGPQSVHGEYGIAKFTFEVKKDGKVVNSGEGMISEDYEDLDAF